jgi:hypothetical protein
VITSRPLRSTFPNGEPHSIRMSLEDYHLLTAGIRHRFLGLHMFLSSKATFSSFFSSLFFNSHHPWLRSSAVSSLFSLISEISPEETNCDYSYFCGQVASPLCLHSLYCISGNVLPPGDPKTSEFLGVHFLRLAPGVEKTGHCIDSSLYVIDSMWLRGPYTGRGRCSSASSAGVHLLSSPSARRRDWSSGCWPGRQSS